MADATATQQIPTDKVTPSPFQARKKFDDASIQELANTLKEHGLRNAINVRPSGDHFELVAGERRWRAAKLLGWQTIEAKVEPADDKESALRGMIENVQREDLSPIEQAQGYKRLSEPPFGLNQSEVGRLVGKDQSLVNKYFAATKLLDHPGGMNQFIPLGLAHLLELCRLHNQADQAALADEAAKKDLSVGQLKALVDQKGGQAKAPSSKAKSNKNPAKNGGGSNEQDPLADVWPPVLSNTDIGPKDCWGMSYKGADTWAFWSKAPSPYSLGALAEWFQRMGQALETELRRQQTEMATAYANPDLPIARSTPGQPASEPRQMSGGPVAAVASADPSDALKDGATQLAVDVAKNLLGGLF